MPNRLAQETSPYLLQHADNPVDWFPWGEEAWAKARAEDKPVLVSIGYSACHWCHVMERESFEDPAHRGADERALRVHQGRPRGAARRRRDLHGRAPGDDRPGRLAAERLRHARAGAVLRRHLLPAALAAGHARAGPRCSTPWPERGPSSATRSATGAERIVEHLNAPARLRASEQAPPETLLADAEQAIRAHFDDVHGGFGGAPKFPPHSTLEFLLGERETEMSLATLRAMARGGIHDQIGGGFARYTVDATWTVPHFEKMLYDNALLARAYLHGWLRSRGDGGAARDVRGHARLGAARDARARGRLLLRARRRLRGRRGQVLRLDARSRSRPCSATGRPRRCASGASRPRGTSRARTSSSRDGTRARPRTSRRCGPRCSPPGRSASGPASTTSG